jgi:hypothetical protein
MQTAIRQDQPPACRRLRSENANALFGKRKGGMTGDPRLITHVSLSATHSAGHFFCLQSAAKVWWAKASTNDMGVREAPYASPRTQKRECCFARDDRLGVEGGSIAKAPTMADGDRASLRTRHDGSLDTSEGLAFVA